MKTHNLLLFVFLFLTTTSAFAKQTALPASGGAQKAKSASANRCDSSCREVVAETLLRSAMDFAANELKVLARRYITNLLKMYPDTKAAAKARVWSRTPGVFLDQSGRLELIITTSSLGLAVGVMLPMALQANDAWIYGASILAFGALGITGAIFGSRGVEMTAGQASLISSGTLLGAWNLTALTMIINMNSDQGLSTGLNIGLPLLGAGLGYAGSLLVGRVAKVTSGRVTMATSSAFFLGAYTGLVLGIARIPVLSDKGTAGWVSLLLSSDIGYVAGWLLHSKLKFSRSRTLLLSLGGVLGAAAGGAVIALTQTLLTDERPAYGMLLGFSLAGIVLATILTRHFKPENESNPFSRSLASNGALFGFQGKRWSFGMPLPTILPEVRKGRELGWNVQVPVINGRW